MKKISLGKSEKDCSSPQSGDRNDRKNKVDFSTV
jgi:hypothetical protein